MRLVTVMGTIAIFHTPSVLAPDKSCQRSPRGDVITVTADATKKTRATILKRESGNVEKSARDLRSELIDLKSADLERVFGADCFVSLDWYRRGLARCAGVARIGREATRGVGTGFLLIGAALHPTLGEELYLLTNSHVVSPSPQLPDTVRPADAFVTFEGLPGAEGKSWTIKKLILCRFIECIRSMVFCACTRLKSIKLLLIIPWRCTSRPGSEYCVVGGA
jgi:hypothetical protein